jgi:CBS domain-containing protein
MHVLSILKAKGSEVATIDPYDTVEVASQRLAERGIGALVVSRDGRRPEGILSERDIARGVAVHGPRLGAMPVSALMSVEVVTCRPGDDIADIMAVMTARRMRHLPVMENGRMCGIVSIGDAVKARLGEIEQEAASLREYIVNS